MSHQNQPSSPQKGQIRLHNLSQQQMAATGEVTHNQLAQLGSARSYNQ